MTIEVNTKDEFLEALKSEDSEVTIILNSDITFDTETNIIINIPEFTLIGSNHKIYYTYIPRSDKFEGFNFCLFHVTGGNITITSTDFEGVLGPTVVTKTWLTDGLQGFFKLDNCQSASFFNVVFSNINYAGIWAFDCNVVTVNYSTFKDISYNYYGYGIWQGGKGSALNQTLLVNTCSFDVCKHAVAGSYHRNHIVAVNNTILHTKDHAFDRHSAKEDGKDIPGIGGGNYIIMNNKFLDDTSYAFGLTVPYPDRNIIISGNEFIQTYGKAGKIDTNVDGKKVVLSEKNIKASNIFIGANKYKNLWCPPYC